VQCLQGADPERGIPRWAFGFLSELDRRGVNIVGLENPELQPVHEQFRTPFTTIAPNTRAELRRLSSDHDVVYLCLSPMEPVRPIRSLLPGHVIDAAIPLVSILYDFALYLMPEAYQTRPGDTRTYADRQRVFSKSDLFLCISKSTTRDAETLWSIPSNHLVWAGTGLNDEISKASVKGADLREFGIERDFVLVVGRADPRKQTAQAIRAFSQLEVELRSRHQLVIVCQISDDIRREWTRLAASCGLDEGQLVLTGRVDDEVLAHLYEECRLFVEPSLYEGFGLPAAEAAVHGAAVITSSTSSLPEILDLPESQFDPTSLDDIARVMTQGLLDEEFRSRLLRAGEDVRRLHSWEVVVDRVLPRLEGMGRRVDVPVRNRQWYLNRGFPANSIGRTIPTSNLDA